MTVPYTNTTCDVYRHGNSPPSAPDVPGVKCALLPKGQSTLTTPDYTHLLLVPTTTDIRDDFSAGSLSAGTNADSLWIPNQNGTGFTVILVRRKGRGTAMDHKEVLLMREKGSGSQSVPWPTNDV
jgi:hypothetical protein